MATKRFYVRPGKALMFKGKLRTAGDPVEMTEEEYDEHEASVSETPPVAVPADAAPALPPGVTQTEADFAAALRAHDARLVLLEKAVAALTEQKPAPSRASKPSPPKNRKKPASPATKTGGDEKSPETDDTGDAAPN